MAARERLTADLGRGLEAAMQRLDTPSAWRVVIVTLPLVYVGLGLARAYPFIDDVTPERSAGDDWLTYKQFALSILNDGLLLRAVDGPYIGPAGFLYNYFLAAIFAILGPNVSYVYVIQSFLLGLSIVGMGLAFSGYVQRKILLFYVIVLGCFSLVDIFWRYTFRLLSENLLLALLPVVLGLGVRLWDRPSPVLGLGTGVVLGLATLARPNLGLFSISMAGLLVWRSLRRRDMTVTTAASTVVGLALTVGLLILRDVLATGQLGLAIVTQRVDYAYPPFNEGIPAAVAFFIRRALFAAGVLPALEPRWPILVHWVAMWVLLSFVTVRRLLYARHFAFYEAVLYLFLFTYLAPLIASAGPITVYGYRLVVPAMPVSLLLTVQGMARWRRLVTML